MGVLRLFAEVSRCLLDDSEGHWPCQVGRLPGRPSGGQSQRPQVPLVADLRFLKLVCRCAHVLVFEVPLVGFLRVVKLGFGGAQNWAPRALAP
jgi:hypothetical protein